MRLFWSSLLAVVLLLPATFIVMVLLEAQFPALDEFTLTMPEGIRAMASQMALRQIDDGPDAEVKIDRAVRLYPENEAAWSRLCAIDRSGDVPMGIAICRKAVSLRANAGNFNRLGAGLEQTGDFCAAEEAYGSAIAIQRDSAELLRNLGRASLRCGHNSAAVTAFELAEGMDRDPQRKDAPAIGDAVLRQDRDNLVLAYEWAQQPEKASELCASVHPGWASCVCQWKAYGAECSDGAVRK